MSVAGAGTAAGHRTTGWRSVSEWAPPRAPGAEGRRSLQACPLCGSAARGRGHTVWPAGPCTVAVPRLAPSRSVAHVALGRQCTQRGGCSMTVTMRMHPQQCASTATAPLARATQHRWRPAVAQPAQHLRLSAQRDHWHEARHRDSVAQCQRRNSRTSCGVN